MVATIIVGAYAYFVVSNDSPHVTDNIVTIEQSTTSHYTCDAFATLAPQDGAENLDRASTPIKIKAN